MALSFGEAEFYGIVKAGSHGLGAVGLLKDTGTSRTATEHGFVGREEYRL